ncbi:flagellar biosynthesis regulator FlaF [Paracoccus sp. J39]|uniref:flagellar biosynthesis regulator FlaF n=1 Tax=Paracoccus sp. J39 TaxID=935848 RepID=UPI0009FF1714|nr:flagellar biosynthesis regulator FlaF [Paracoccus sp. J39]
MRGVCGDSARLPIVGRANCVAPALSRAWLSHSCAAGIPAAFEPTQKLQKAIEDSDHPPMIEAIYANNQLWTALAADLAHPENGLPAETKAGLLSLAIFSLKQGRRVVEERLSAISLVEINLRVMKGLRGEIK